MSDKLRVTKRAVVAMFQAIGFKMAHKYDTNRLLDKVKVIGTIADDTVDLPDAEEATLIAIQEAVENGVEVELVDGPIDDAEPVDAPVDDPGDDAEPDAEPTDDELATADGDAESETEAAEPVAEKPAKKKKRGRKAKAATGGGKKSAKVETETPAEKPAKAKVKKENRKTRLFCAGVIVKKHGFETKVTDQMAAEVCELCGKKNAAQSLWALKLACDSISGYFSV